MADVYDYIEDTGVIQVDAGAILEEVQQEYKNIFGTDLNVDPSTPQGMLISIETTSRIAVADNNVNLANQINPNVAGGVFLDALLQLTGAQRTPATYSTVNCNITGVSGTFIPAGSQISTSDGETVFDLISDLTIPVTGSVSNVSFRSNVIGAIPASANTLTRIVTVILGWESVINPLAATLGTLTQSDIAARQQRLNTLGSQGNSLAANVFAALYSIPGVSSAGITLLENVTSTVQVIDEIIMVPHSIYVCVGGTSNYSEIAASLSNSKSAGCAYNNGLGIPIQQIYTNPYSMQAIEVLFDVPSMVNIGIQVTVHALTTVPNLVVSVQNAILTYAAGGINGQPGFTVGTDVSPFQLAAAINLLVPGVFVQNIQISVLSFTQQGLLTNGSNSVTNLTYNAPVGGFVGIQTGMLVTSDNGDIPNGTTVSSIVGSNAITLSNPATFVSFNLQGTILNGSNAVTGLTDNSSIEVGMDITGTGIPGGTTVTALVGTTEITISNNATASGKETLTFTPAAGATRTEILTFYQTPLYSSSDIPIGVWQQAYTTASNIQVIQV